MTEESFSDSSILQTGRAVIQREAQALTALPEQLDDGFIALVRGILLLQGKVVTTGAGTSGIMAERLAHLLAVSGTPSFYLPCVDALHGGMGAITSGDLVIGFSKGGHSEEMISLASKIVERGHPFYAVTERPDSAFAQRASNVIHVKTIPPEADLGGLIATGSTLVAGALGDALAGTLMALRGHSWEEVRDVHPGGILGKQTVLPSELSVERGVAE